MARRKSANDLIAQYRRIEKQYGTPTVNTRGKIEMHPRVAKARDALSRYVNNINYTLSGRKAIKASNDAFNNSADEAAPRQIMARFNDRKFARSTYMGLNAG